ncbi:hypothetical protein THRCLA_05897 [Thraustotheca clavata]|uniref:Uncharacterized protein n=1 Tax=Thraustotheca clavata TaxID=74557 RepID=A0A1V9ZRR6_9STRA|nr:hypothetical protein THRCLA_05897 [Thraustotheca clavata]
MDGTGLNVLHWACLQEDIPLYILVEIISTFPDAALEKNAQGQLPHEIATSCRQQVLDILFAAYPFNAQPITLLTEKNLKPLRWQEDLKCGELWWKRVRCSF